MAVRLQMKLGVVAEGDRLPDSPDSIVVVEPTVGSVARSKGQLYVVVTGLRQGPRMADATRLVAETIRSEYYYDESAGIKGCLVKAIAAANKRLLHARDKLGLAAVPGAGGPVGVALAVVRGSELYVATVGPAEAYLVRGAQLSTLPDPHRERGMPAADLEPDVWRGEMSVGDQLVLVSPNVMSRLAVDELKDALVTLHPQSAMEHLHHRFVAADGSGSDGLLAIEATEVAVLRSGPALVPVRPSEPLAGGPDRSPIPLADTVSGGVAAAQAGAERARAIARGLLGRLVARLQDLLPERAPAARRVTPFSARRETQRRAAMASLAFIVVLGGLGLGVFLFAGREPTGPVIASLTTGQRALEAARTALDRVSGPGIDLVADAPETALELLGQALEDLAAAEAAGIARATTDPLRERAVAGLDRLYGVVDVGAASTFTFPDDPAVDLAALIRGPDGAPYVLDRAGAAVFRIDLAERTAVAIFREGAKAAGAVEAAPRFITVGGPDLLIVDASNAVWRWRPADAHGTGTTTLVRVQGAAEWGDDIRAVGTFLRDADTGLYNFYVVDPSAQQILAYAPAADGSGFPAAPSGRLATARPVDAVTDLFIDGDIWVADGGTIVRFAGGKAEGWTAAEPGDVALRPAPSYRRITSGGARREGRLYAWDPVSERVIALRKSDGSFIEQYRLTDGATDWSDIRGWYVEAGIDDGPDALVWITAQGLRRALLEAAVSGPVESPDLSPGASPADSGAP